MVISADDELGASGDCTFENAVVIFIVRNCVETEARTGNFGDLADFLKELGGVGSVKMELVCQLVAEFLEKLLRCGERNALCSGVVQEFSGQSTKQEP